jgi:trimeric autotransporter adhesin
MAQVCRRFAQALWGALGTFAVPPAALSQTAPDALPSGGSVAAGSVHIDQSGARMDIEQSSQRAIVNWQQFDIGRDAQVNIRQPNRDAAILNRVTNQRPSEIQGRLDANGQVFVINPAGIVFGEGAQVNVGGIVASTLDIADRDFMDGKYRFQRNGTLGKVVNLGRITAADGGYIALLAPELRNEGVLAARLGTVVLAAGEAVTLSIGDNLAVEVDPATVRTLIDQKAMIQAEGGRVILTAKALDRVLAGAINLDGHIEAGSIVRRGGEVVLEGGGPVDVNIAGVINVEGLTGGRVEARAGQGASVKLSGARVEAGGEQGGGEIRLGDWETGRLEVDEASRLDASARARGQGGEVVAIGREASFKGTARARGGRDGGDGGFVETSGRTLEVGGARIDAGAEQGQAGSWLLDPTDITIDATLAGTIADSLATTDVTVATLADGADFGDIVVASQITPTVTEPGGTTLTLQAHRSILFSPGAGIDVGTGSEKLNIVMWSRYGGDDAGTDGKQGSVWVPVGVEVKSGGGNIVIGGGSDAVSGFAMGDDVSSGENNARYRGVTINGLLDAAGGNISIRGRGAPSASAARGVSIGGTVQTTGSGTITIAGISKGASDPVAIGDSAISDLGKLESFNGDITITGTKNTGSLGFNLSRPQSLIQIGGTGNLQILAPDANIQLNGDILGGTGNVYAEATGNILLNSGSSITLGGSGNVTAKATGNIEFTNASLTTALGSVVLWSDSDGVNGGNSLLNSGSSIATNGGHLWMGGGSGSTTWNGLTVGSGPASGSVVGDNNALYSSGINLNGASGAINLSTNGGEIYLYGASHTAGGPGVRLVNSTIDSGASGALNIRGDGIYGAGSNGFGISLMQGAKIRGGGQGATLSANANLAGGSGGWSYALALGAGTDTSGDTYIYTTDGGKLTINLRTESTGTSDQYFGEMKGALGHADQNGDIEINTAGAQLMALALPNITLPSGDLTINAHRGVANSNASAAWSVDTSQSIAGTTTINASGNNVVLGALSDNKITSFSTEALTIENAVNTLQLGSMTVGAGGIYAKATGNIELGTNASLTTSGGKVVFWSDSDGSSGGHILLNSGSSIATNGGHLWMGGGSGSTTWNDLTVGDAPAIGAATGSSGIYLDGNPGSGVSLSTGGGQIWMSGQGNTDGGGGIKLEYASIDTGTSGGLTLRGDGVYGGGNNGHGVMVEYDSQIRGGSSGITLNANSNINVGSANWSFPLSLAERGRIYTTDNGQLLLNAARSGSGDGYIYIYGDGTLGHADQQNGDIEIIISGDQPIAPTLPNIAIKTGNLAVITPYGIAAGGTQSIAGTTSITNTGADYAVNLGTSGSFQSDGALSIASAENISVQSVGALTLGTLSATGTVLAKSGGTGDLTLQAGASITTSTAMTDAVTLVSSGKFINNAGASPISLTGTGTPRWLVYSQDITNDTRGDLSGSFNRYGCTYGGTCPTDVSIPETGNGFVYQVRPTAILTAEKTYDGDAEFELAEITVTGGVGGDTLALDGTGSATAFSSQADNADNYLTGLGALRIVDQTSGAVLGYQVDLTGRGPSNQVTINPAAVSLNFSGSKAYDGTPRFQFSDLTFTGVQGSDEVLLGGWADVSSRHVGTYDEFVDNQLILTGAQATNYSVTGGTVSVSITPLALTLTAPTVSKVYDGLLSYAAQAADLTALSEPLIVGDTVTVATIAYTDRNAGTNNRSVTLSGVTVEDGNAGSNYSLTLAGNSTSTITPAPLHLHAGSDSKFYDGTAASSGSVSYSGLQAGDSLTGLTQAFDSRHAGSRTLDVTGYALNDGNNGLNYSLSFHSASGSIQPRPVTLTSPVVSKEYDGLLTYTTRASDLAALSSALVAGDTVTAATLAYTDKNAGSGTRSVTLSGVTVEDGHAGGNYSLTLAGNSTSTITPAPATLRGSKVYDGTPAFEAAQITVLGIGSETLGWSGSGGATAFSGSVADNALNYLTGLGGLTLADGTGLASNYVLPALTARSAWNQVTIDAAALALDFAGSRVYDGTPTFLYSELQIAGGVLPGDTVSLVGGSATVASKNAGPYTAFTSHSLMLGGADKDNYRVSGGAVNVSITPRALLLTAPSVSKIYDGGLTYTTRASDLAALSSALVAGDTVTAATLAYTDKNAGSGTRSVTLSGVTVDDGHAGGNYSLTLAGNSTSTITPAPATLRGSKVYDGTTALSAGQITVLGIGSETLRLSGSGGATAFSGSVADNALNYLTGLGGLTLADGTGLASNYVLPALTARSAWNQVTIDAAALALDFAGSRIYDGTPTFLYSELQIAGGVLPGDTVSLVGGSATVASQNAGPYTAFTSHSLMLGGADKDNYRVSGGAVHVSITPRALLLTAPVREQDLRRWADLHDSGIRSSGAVERAGGRRHGDGGDPGLYRQKRRIRHPERDAVGGDGQRRQRRA